MVAIGRWPGRQRAAGPAEAWVGDGTIAPGDPVRGDESGAWPDWDAMEGATAVATSLLSDRIPAHLRLDAPRVTILNLHMEWTIVHDDRTYRT